MIVVVEGNIGAGKTRLCHELCRLFDKTDFYTRQKRRRRAPDGGDEVVDERRLRAKCIEEPVHEWTEGENLLAHFYKDVPRWALTFQFKAYLTMLRNERKAVEYSDRGHLVFLERSLYSSRCVFADLLLASSCTQMERDTWDEWLEEMEIEGSPVELHESVVAVYLDTPTKLCHDRVLKRARPEEVGAIDVHYLDRVRTAYLETLRGFPVTDLIVVDGTSYDGLHAREAVISGIDEKAVDRIKKHLDVMMNVYEKNDTLTTSAAPSSTPNVDIPTSSA